MVLPLISEHYREQNKQLHAQMAHYGSNGVRHLKSVLHLREIGGYGTILDYGCGKGSLVKALQASGVDAKGYDPAIDEYSARPEPADLVVCTDVLEHIEPDCLDAVLDDIAGLTKQVALVLVHTAPAKKFLPDGRNAHLIQKPAEAWRKDLEKRFFVAMLKGDALGFTAVLHR